VLRPAIGQGTSRVVSATAGRNTRCVESPQGAKGSDPSLAFLANAGNAVHTVYIASLPPGPVWLLHCMYSGVTAFMLAAHLRWTKHGTRMNSGPRAASHRAWQGAAHTSSSSVTL
jgi:hypothetical protein